MKDSYLGVRVDDRTSRWFGSSQIGIGAQIPDLPVQDQVWTRFRRIMRVDVYILSVRG